MHSLRLMSEGGCQISALLFLLGRCGVDYALCIFFIFAATKMHNRKDDPQVTTYLTDRLMINPIKSHYMLRLQVVCT